jgi:hypothetical protein
MFFPERRVKSGLRPDFPGTLTVNYNPSTPADQEQNFFGCIMDMVWNHASDFSNVHPHRHIFNSPEFGSQKELGCSRWSPKLALYIRRFDKWHFAHKITSSMFHYAKSRSILKVIPLYVKLFRMPERQAAL